jgi:hypothetical protein
MADTSREPPSTQRQEKPRKLVRPYVAIFRGLFSKDDRHRKEEPKRDSTGSLGRLLVGAVIAAFLAYLVANYYKDQGNGIPSNGLLAGLGTFDFSQCKQEGTNLQRKDIVRTIMLALHHILYAQLAEGNFLEEYNWKNLTVVKRREDSSIQARALWSLALAYRHVRGKARYSLVSPLLYIYFKFPPILVNTC